MDYYEEDYDRRREIIRQRKKKRRLYRRIRWLVTKIIPTILIFVGIIVLSVVGIRKVINTIAGETVISEESDQKKDISEQLKRANEELLSKNKAEEEERIRLEEEQRAYEESLKRVEFSRADNQVSISDEVDSSNVIVVDISSGQIIADRGSTSRIVPASMTKVLTLLVAVEELGDTKRLDDKFTVTFDITNYAYVHDCSVAGFMENEEVTVRDLLYGTILPSGGDAAVALATYIAGSQDAFVEKMNDKLASLGLSDTAHFTNCVGLYDDNHYCTPYDMAAIMYAAMQNDLCREVMSAHIYTTSSTAEHPDGLELSNWFLRRIEDKDCGMTVVSAKTGYVKESGNCAVSYAEDESGKGYICVSANAHSSWRCIYDHVAIYKGL